MKTCSRCKELKAEECFYPRRSRKNGQGRQSHCIDCVKKRSYEWNRTNPEKFKAAFARYRRKFLYGITEEIYQGLITQQGRVCAICSKVPEKFHVDHCHKTGRIRGLLCQKCNHAIGLLDEDLKRFDAAKHYLERSR